MKFTKLSTVVVVTLISGAMIFSAAAYTGAQITERDKPKPELGHVANGQGYTPAVKLQQVAVQKTTAATYQALVSGYGEAHAEHELSYTSEVSGRVQTIAVNFAAGRIVAKGTVLATVEDTSYQQALSQAKADVAQARLDLLEEQRQGEQAKLEWKRSGLSGEPASPLVLRKPQLVNAQATLENARLALKKAQRDVDNTVIRAPFDALVVSRDVEPGSYVQAASQVATLYSISRVEITVPLSKLQWDSLPKIDNSALQQKQWTVTLRSSDGQEKWSGYVTRVQQHLAEDTRQRSLVVAVDKPLDLDNPLYPGTFVQAMIPGQSIENLWELPASSVSQQGDIWLVDENGLLSQSAAQVRFTKQGKVYAEPVDDLRVAKVVKRPLSSFQSHMKVAPVVESKLTEAGHD